jgi:aspartyl-tRNA(Asn)/glutamyl-tRNA(Gln) amidotransferase subunit C
MARVTRETVDHVARLAHLSLTEPERQLFTRQLEEILAWAESLPATEGAGGAAEADPPPSREDVPRPGLGREEALAAAPDPAEGLFRVPRVIG